MIFREKESSMIRRILAGVDFHLAVDGEKLDARREKSRPLVGHGYRKGQIDKFLLIFVARVNLSPPTADAAAKISDFFFRDAQKNK